jgi:hypothetical protein
MRVIVLIVVLCLMCLSCGEGSSPVTDPPESWDLAMAADLGGDEDSPADIAEDIVEDVASDLAVDMGGEDGGEQDIGVVEQCPVVARASGYVLGGGTPPSSMIGAMPLSTIKLSALESEAVGGRVERVEWNLTTRPNGSTARLLPDNRAMEPSLFLDLAGGYELEVYAWDAEGRRSCEPARVVIMQVGI